jgi:Flp pilus assembly protein TadG
MLRAKGEDGVVLVEFALVFALFVFILYALVAFGAALALKQTVTHAAAEGARAAVGVIDNPSTTEDEREEKALQEVESSLDWIGDKWDPADVTADVRECRAGSTDSCIFVTIDYPYKDKPIVPPSPGLGVVMPDSMKSNAVVKID